MKKEDNKSPHFLILCDNKKNNIKNSLFEVECFLNNFNNFSDLFTIFKIINKKK